MALSARDRRALIIFGATAVLAAAVFFLFVSKGSEGVATAPGGSGGVSAIAGSPAPAPTPTVEGTTNEVLVFSGRDPFDPAQGGGTVAPPADTGTQSGEPTSNPGGSTTPPPTTSSGGSSSAGITFVLVDVFTEDGVDKAQVEVDGTIYIVTVGATFGDGYQLVSIEGTCAEFRLDITTFNLCEAPASA